MFPIAKYPVYSEMMYGVGSGYNKAARDFIDATGITDFTQRLIINQLVTNLQAAKLWHRMSAIYPIIGGTSDTHKYNLRNPSQFNLAYTGTVNHSSTGMTGSGTGYADTGISVVTIPQNDVHISYYSRTNTASSSVEMGVSNVGTSKLEITCKWSDNIHYFAASAQEESAGVISTGSGYYISNRTNPANHQTWKNGVRVASITRASVTPSNLNIYILVFNLNGVPTFYSTKQCGFATVGNSLTDAEQVVMYNIVQNYQTMLNRQI